MFSVCLQENLFWGGTFFPKEDRGEGIAPWPQVLIRISEHFRKHPEELAENAQNVMKNLEHSNNSECSGSSPWNNELLVTAIKKFHELHDDLYGGFTRAPKFPPSMKIDFLLGTLESEYAKQRPEVQAGNENCITKTLEGLATGGIFDQLDGGFFRYSIDEKWSVPHFEKMLIENSLLISTYSKAFRKFKNPLYAKVIRKTLDWVFREMGNEKLGFSSSSSAESENAHGKYYLWKETELVEVLGQNNAKMFIKDLDKLSLGDSNFFLPRLRESEEENEILEKRLFPLLREVRVLRTHPKKDEKRVLSFNASMIGALVEASIALNEIELLNRACELANWLNENFLIKEKMFSVLYFNEEEVRKMHSPSLDDLVFWAENLLILASKSEMVHLGSSESYLKDATVIMDTVKDQYKDQRNPGFFTSSNRAIHPPPLRKKVWFDNSTPSGNSSLLRVFSMLFAFTKDKKWHSEYLKAKSAYPNLAKKNPEGIAYAITCILEEAMGIVTITIPKRKDGGFRTRSIPKASSTYYREGNFVQGM